MRGKIFFLLFVALASFCTITVYLYQHRGNVVCLRGASHNYVQPTADAWYRETKWVVEFYQDHYKSGLRAFNAEWKSVQLGLKGNTGKTMSQSYSKMTNTLFQSIEARKKSAAEH
jgi:hypothetical protein